MDDARLVRLKELYSDVSYIDQAISLLSWDQETYMPSGAVMDRAGQMSTFSAIYHRRITDPEIGKLVGELGNAALPEGESAIVREIARAYKRKTALPESFVKEMATETSLGQHAWQGARAKDDFSIFKPHLERILELKKREAEYVGYSDRPYDALLDDFEPYMRSRDVDALFSSLRGKLVDIARRISESGIQPDESPVTRGYKKELQERFCLHLAKTLNFDFERGRLDISAHPFTSGTRRDVRITTRFDEKDLRNSVFSTIHETGHALYEQGYSEENYLTPLAEAVSLGVHESQSRFWENIVGRSKPFWKFMLPSLKKHFPTMKGVKLDQFHSAINIVKPSLIRTESDEVTYNLHILIRFEIETAMLEGKVSVDEIPSVWNEKYEKYLGITPPNNTKGCLQDIHWSMGLMGYFPTYTLGNLYSAQIHAAMLKDIPEFDSLVASGQFMPILNWLRERIHRKGKLYPPRELIQRATGSAPDEEFYVNYLRKKFSEIYGISL